MLTGRPEPINLNYAFHILLPHTIWRQKGNILHGVYDTSFAEVYMAYFDIFRVIVTLPLCLDNVLISGKCMQFCIDWKGLQSTRNKQRNGITWHKA